MELSQFNDKVKQLFKEHEKLITQKNQKKKYSYGLYDKYEYPVVTDRHTPVFWRYDLDPKSNPFLMERMGINATFNPGAIAIDNTIYLALRTEGWDRKSFFAIAESTTGIDNFRIWDIPVELPQTSEPDTNVYDIRLVRHEDGWIYGIFCTERKDPEAPPGDEHSALAHGVRNTAAGLRYVLYMFMTDLKEPWKIIKKPGGYFLAPEDDERVGDVSNVVFSNGWVEKPNGEVFIYYASSDTRTHVAATTRERLIDYALNRTWRLWNITGCFTMVYKYQWYTTYFLTAFCVSVQPVA